MRLLGMVLSCALLTTLALAHNRRDRTRWPQSHHLRVAAGGADAGNLPTSGEAVAFCAACQSNGWYQAQDTTAQLTTTVDAGVWRGGVDASTTMPEAVQGVGAGGTGSDYASSDVVIARELYRLMGLEQYLVNGVTKGGTDLAGLQASQEYADTFDDNGSLDRTCLRAGATGCFVPYLIWDHGESDDNATPNLSYGTDFITHKSTIMTELQSGRTEGGDWLARYRPHVFGYVRANWPKMHNTDTESQVSPLMISAAQSDSDLIICGGTYHFGDSTTSVWNVPPDSLHQTATGQHLKGEHAARCIWAQTQNYFAPNVWMYPATAQCSGSSVVLDYAGTIPCADADINDCGGTDLTFDTTNVACPYTGTQGGLCRYGFEVDDPNPNPRWISAAPTISGSQVTIPLSGACRAGTTVSYAHTSCPGAAAGNGLMVGDDDDLCGPRGNLRDTTTTLGGITGQAVVSWATPIHDLALSGGAAGGASVATVVNDLNWDFLIDGDDCPTGTNAWTNSGLVGGSFTHVNGSVTCAQDTGATPSAQIGADNVDQGAAPSTSLYESNGHDLGSNDDVLFMWMGCANDADATQDFVHWWGATQEYFRVFVGSTGTMTFQFDTRTNGGSALVSQNLLSAFPNGVADRREWIATLYSRDADTGNEMVTMCSAGSCTSTTKLVTTTNMSAADVHFMASRTNGNHITSTTYFAGLASGEKVRGRWQNYKNFADWYESAYSSFCGTTPCACND